MRKKLSYATDPNRALDALELEWPNVFTPTFIVGYGLPQRGKSVARRFLAAETITEGPGS